MFMYCDEREKIMWVLGDADAKEIGVFRSIPQLRIAAEKIAGDELMMGDVEIRREIRNLGCAFVEFGLLRDPCAMGGENRMVIWKR